MTETSTQRDVDGEKPAAPTYGASDHYDARYFAWQNSNIEIKTRIKIQRFAPHIRPTDTVIDFGCAGGALIAGLNCARRIGVELNDVARASAVEQYGIEAYKSLAEVPDGIADVVISNHVLEHIAAPYDALRQLKPKIKPEGKLVLVLPIDDFRAQRQWDPNDINRHLYTWSPLNLGNLLDEAGYQPVQMKVLRHTLMRGLDKFAKLPEPAFEAVCRLYSYVRHRQELLAVAVPRP
ncbi:MAG TPA: class I SAM-dependent methyltransferase [Micromonosporaceae bacterium]